MIAAEAIPTAPPARRSALGRAGLVAFAAAALTLSARITVPVGPVPITAQTLAVLLVGALLGPAAGVGSILAYLAAGIAGLPVFAGGAGASYLLGPTGGYLVGFVPAAYLAGALTRQGWARRPCGCLLALIAADAALFAFGLAWLALYVRPAGNLLLVGLLPFLPGEAVKITIAALVLEGRRGKTRSGPDGPAEP